MKAISILAHHMYLNFYFFNFDWRGIHDAEVLSAGLNIISGNGLLLLCSNWGYVYGKPFLEKQMESFNDIPKPKRRPIFPVGGDNFKQWEGRETGPGPRNMGTDYQDNYDYIPYDFHMGNSIYRSRYNKERSNKLANIKENLVHDRMYLPQLKLEPVEFNDTDYAFLNRKRFNYALSNKMHRPVYQNSRKTGNINRNREYVQSFNISSHPANLVNDKITSTYKTTSSATIQNKESDNSVTQNVDLIASSRSSLVATALSGNRRFFAQSQTYKGMIVKKTILEEVTEEHSHDLSDMKSSLVIMTILLVPILFIIIITLFLGTRKRGNCRICGHRTQNRRQTLFNVVTSSMSTTGLVNAAGNGDTHPLKEGKNVRFAKDVKTSSKRKKYKKSVNHCEESELMVVGYDSDEEYSLLVPVSKNRDCHAEA